MTKVRVFLAATVFLTTRMNFAARPAHSARETGFVVPYFGSSCTFQSQLESDELEQRLLDPPWVWAEMEPVLQQLKRRVKHGRRPGRVPAWPMLTIQEIAGDVVAPSTFFRVESKKKPIYRVPRRAVPARFRGPDRLRYGNFAFLRIWCGTGDCTLEQWLVRFGDGYDQPKQEVVPRASLTWLPADHLLAVGRTGETPPSQDRRFLWLPAADYKP